MRKLNFIFKISNLKFKKGFTLIEVLVVIGILGILGGISTFSISKSKDKGFDSRRKADLKAIETAAVAYYHDHGFYPPDPAAYAGTAFSSTTGGNWIPGLESYINSTPKDPKQAGLINLLAGLIRQQAVHTTQFLASLIGNPNTKSNQQGQVAGAATSIAFDSASTSTGTATATLSWGHTIANASNRILIVTVSYDPAGGQTVSSITYGGAGLNKTDGSGANMVIANGTNVRVEMWKLVAPTIGTNNITVTMTSAVNGISAGGVSFTGVNATTPLGTAVSANSSGTAASVTISSTASQVLIDGLGYNNGVAVPTAAAGQTTRWQQVVPTRSGAGSTRDGASSTTMSWSLSTGVGWALIAVPLNPSNIPPTNGTLTAGPACVNYGTQYRFTTTYNDPDGYGTILYAYILINSTQPYDTTTAPVGAFSAVLNNQTVDIGIRDDANTTWNWGASGINGNSYATLNRATSKSTGSGSTLTVNWDLTFNSAWQPENANVWIKVTDTSSAATTYSSIGAVQIPCPPTDPTITSCSITPTTLAVGQNVTITATVKNNRATAISTQTPDSGFSYLEAQSFSSLGYTPVSGKFRMGVDNGGNSYPWRWGFGPPSTTTLAAGASTTGTIITGTITMGTAGTKNLSIGLVEESIAWRDTGKCPTIVTVNAPLPTPTPTPTPAPTPSPTPSPTPTPGPTPIPGATTCASTAFVYCYRVATDRSSFVIWAELDNTNDPQGIAGSSATCKLTPPAENTNLNYCLDSSTL